MLKIGSRYLLSVFFIAAGAMHFIQPAAYLPLMPEILPYPLALIYLSGAAEIFGGLGLLIPARRYWAGWGLIALLVAVFPANIHMLTDRPLVLGTHPPTWVLWLRLPLQGVLIAWVWWVAQTGKERFISSKTGVPL